ncbi:MarR family winged helix-turn-helix transcriptional regulator [Mycobacterium bourgelatii]|uniref:MarR family transcriptional regulator n=1 Tax=Mycobacterium bourgelatii TaxID=1273442 RepID=A0A7I9YZE9_MYCBU|nr:MarR family transcriptional regulator [Mycobacterium bourgelatii]MCV6976539.1 MarR family transcriptional regulator [Mycobacterium bourgelatii]GFG93988.1 MarR family transcriptional regulator [Mycobacterium bourgelatii]
MSTRTDLSADVPRVLGRFRRQLRRAAGTGYAPGRLSESQAELLRLVSHRPGISVSLAAAELGLVPNTASTLVTKLVRDGFLLREVDDSDRRVCRLRLTDSAQHAMDATAAARRAVLSELLDKLDDEQRRVLGQGLEVLEEMTRMLREPGK